jgi:Mg/Co/Ni transporter MgtE
LAAPEAADGRESFIASTAIRTSPPDLIRGKRLHQRVTFGEVERATRLRVVWIAVAMVSAYLVALVLLVLVAGFDHGLDRWAFAAVFIAIAAGMTASLTLRFALVADPQLRMRLWTSARQRSRALFVGALLARAIGVVVIWRLALMFLGR